MTNNHMIMTRSGAHWAPAVGLVFLVPLMLVGIVDHSFLLISLGAVALAIMMVPILRTRQIDWFSPWNWMFYAVFLGVFLRSIYITFDIPDAFTIQSGFLLGKSKEFLLWPMVLVLLGLCCMTLGYLAGPSVSRKISYKVFQSDDWAENRFWVVVFILQLLSFIGLYLYIKNTAGQISMENISSHRGISADLNEYNSYSYLRWLISLSDIVSCLLVARIISERRFHFKKIVAFMALLISTATSFFFSFFSQTRSGLAVWFLNIVVIIYYLRNKKLPLFRTITLFIFVLVSARYMIGLRAGSGFDKFSLSNFNMIRLFEPLILSINGIDVSKTAHIMAAIPEYLDYQYGATLLRIVYLWIPRQIWPAKPVNVDTTVGMAVYGAETYGAGAVPPGLIAEMYWNFWIPGIIVGCFSAGYLLKIIYTQFKRYDTNRNVVILYTTCFMGMGAGFMGSGFASELMGFLMTFLPSIIVLHIITKRGKYMPDKVNL